MILLLCLTYFINWLMKLSKDWLKSEARQRTDEWCKTKDLRLNWRKKTKKGDWKIERECQILWKGAESKVSKFWQVRDQRDGLSRIIHKKLFILITCFQRLSTCYLPWYKTMVQTCNKHGFGQWDYFGKFLGNCDCFRQNNCWQTGPELSTTFTKGLRCNSLSLYW